MATLSKQTLELEIEKCKAAIIGFNEGVAIHKLLKEALEGELTKLPKEAKKDENKQ